MITKESEGFEILVEELEKLLLEITEENKDRIWGRYFMCNMIASYSMLFSGVHATGRLAEVEFETRRKMKNRIMTLLDAEGYGTWLINPVDEYNEELSRAENNIGVRIIAAQWFALECEEEERITSGILSVFTD